MSDRFDLVRLTTDSRVKVSAFEVYPTIYDEMTLGDKDKWALKVTDGHQWGWSVRQGIHFDSSFAMNRKGQWIMEHRGDGKNKFRRYPLEEALELALRFVDTHKVSGMNAREVEEWVLAKRGVS